MPMCAWFSRRASSCAKTTVDRAEEEKRSNTSSASRPCQCTDSDRVKRVTSWEDRLARWKAEVELFAQLDDLPWVPLAVAEAETGASRSALRSWYRSGQLPSRLVDGPNGPERLVPLDAVVERAARSPRIQRRAERGISLEAQVALLSHRLDQLEQRFAALEAVEAVGAAEAVEAVGAVEAGPPAA